jgi:predicted Zn finger-like uncharacterized protein
MSMASVAIRCPECTYDFMVHDVDRSVSTLSVRCHACAHAFVVDISARSGSTLRSLAPVNVPIRDGVPVCKRCGYVTICHGPSSVAEAHGCAGFIEPA